MIFEPERGLDDLQVNEAIRQSVHAHGHENTFAIMNKIDVSSVFLTEKEQL